jgi:hypothetical protein
VARSPSGARGTGFTFDELWLKIGPRSGAGRADLALVLRQEVDAGRVDYLASSRRFVLNGGLPADVRLALRDLEL